MRIIVTAALCGMAMLAQAFGEEQANPKLQARAEALIAEQPDGKTIWTADQTGKVHHIQSGMECLPAWPILMPLNKLMSFPSPQGPGTDVACDYASGIDSSKLDIYAQKLPGLTLDQAFAKYRAEIVDYHKDAQSKGTFADVKSAGLSIPAPADIRTEIFSYNDAAGVPSWSYLLVAQQDGWTVEVRMTKPVESDKRMDNRLFAFAALFGARQSIAKANDHAVTP